MALSNDLISQFVKITKDNEKNKNESIVYGTITTKNNTNYVKIDGSELLTPISTTTVVKNGDRVTVMLKNHTATITGNLTSPAPRSNDIIDVEKLNAQKARIDSLEAANITIQGTLDANSANINNLYADNATIKNTLNANNADIDELQTENATIKGKITANEAAISNLEATTLTSTEIEATYATINNLNTQIGRIDILEANNITSDFIASKYATIENLNAQKGRIDVLESTKLSASDIEGLYANIDFSNISKATMEQFYANSGLIQDVAIGDATITGKLIGVTISGDLIEAGTLVADKLVIQGENGLYYKLNTDGVTVETEQTDHNSLNGSVIISKSITASKISVDDLVAFDATIGGFNITANSIYSGVKSAVSNTTRGVYLDNEGQIAFGDASHFVKYYKDSNGNYKLVISADSIDFGSNDTNLETIIDDIQANTNNTQDSVDALALRMTTAETNIGENSDAIALRATKTEVETAKSEAILSASSDATTKANNALSSANANTANLLKDYSTTSEMNAAIELKADNITSTVSSTYATKAALNTTNTNVSSAQSTADTAKANAATAQSTANTAKTNALAAAKTATDYLNLSSAGLVVGQNPANPTAGNTLISTDGVSIRKGTTVLAAFKAASRTASGISSAILTSSDVTDSESDGATSVKGTVSRNETRANVYISTNGNPVYFPNGLETDKVLINNSSGIISNSNILLNGSIVDNTGEGIFTPINSYGNTIIGYGRYEDGGGTHIYGNRVKAKTIAGFSASVNGVAALDTNNSSGNATFGWHLYEASKGETNIYGNIVSMFSKDDIRLNANANNIRINGNIIPYQGNAFNIGTSSYSIHDIYISCNDDNTEHGLRFSNTSGSYNAVGINPEGYQIFGNTNSCTNIITKSTTTSNTGYSFKITCGDNPALVLGDSDARLFLFGGTDSTSRYIGSIAAYKRTYSSAANMCVTANGIIGRSTSSSERYKTDISVASIDELKGLYNLPIKKFKYKNEYIATDDELYNKYLYGFIVEDLVDVLPCAVQHIKNENGEMVPEMWNSNIIIPSMLKLIQDLNNRIKILEEKGA